MRAAFFATLAIAILTATFAAQAQVNGDETGGTTVTNSEERHGVTGDDSSNGSGDETWHDAEDHDTDAPPTTPPPHDTGHSGAGHCSNKPKCPAGTSGHPVPAHNTPER